MLRMKKTYLICAVALVAALAALGPNLSAADDALYRALGGKGGVAALVDEFIEIIADDIRVAPTFADTDIAHFRMKLIEQLCALSRGPCEYTGDQMHLVHKGLNITERQFNAVVEDLQEAMARLRLPEPAQNRLLARLAPLRGQIIYR